MGLAAGILSGLFGIGGGVVIVGALVTFAKFPMHRAIGTSLAVFLVLMAVRMWMKAGG
jgi:uncharacterized membrane protein YfcA